MVQGRKSTALPSSSPGKAERRTPAQIAREAVQPGSGVIFGTASPPRRKNPAATADPPFSFLFWWVPCARAGVKGPGVVLQRACFYSVTVNEPQHGSRLDPDKLCELGLAQRSCWVGLAFPAAHKLGSSSSGQPGVRVKGWGQSSPPDTESPVFPGNLGLGHHGKGTVQSQS